MNASILWMTAVEIIIDIIISSLMGVYESILSRLSALRHNKLNMG
jgi:hypothetical protein